MNPVAIHSALVDIFGAEPEQIVMTNRDHLSITANFRQLCLAVGGSWARLVEDLDAKIEERKSWKDPGADARLLHADSPRPVAVAMAEAGEEFGDKA